MEKIIIKSIFAMKSFLKQNPIGKMYYAPIDVFFDDYNQSQPDILFIKEG